MSAQAAAAESSTANAAFVEAVFHDILGRPADPAGLAWGTALLNAGQPREVVVEQLVYSDEAYRDYLDSVYQRYLGRAADQAGLSYWLDQMHAGVRNEALEVSFLASDEFLARTGGTMAGWVDAAFEAVFSRHAETAAVTWATSQLESGVSLTELAAMLMMSPEGEGKRVERDFAQFQAPLDPTSDATFAAELADGQISEESLAVAYLLTPDYFDARTGVPVTTVPVPNLIPMAQPVMANIAAQAAQGNANVLFLGDSITQLWGITGLAEWNQDFAPLESLNAGVGGDTTQNVLWRLDQGTLSGISPKLAVVMVGVNNLTNSASDVASGITAVVQTLRDDYPGIRVLLLGILPASQVAADSPLRQEIDQINQMITPLADGQHVWFLDVGSRFVNSDGSLNESLYQLGNIHPNEQGYAVLAQAIAPWVQALS